MGNPCLNTACETIDEDICNPDVTRYRRQINRCKQWIARLRSAKGDPGKLYNYNVEASRLISRDTDNGDDFAKDICSLFPEMLTQPIQPVHTIKLMRLAGHYEKLIAT